MISKIITVFVIINFTIIVQAGILYPRPSATRDVRNLNGLWSFSIINNSTTTLSGKADDRDLFLMPVPSSYNDILTTIEGRDFVGCIKYEKTFSVPKPWKEKRIWLRFGSVRYAADVYINEQLIMSHDIGHLPFEAEITPYVNDGLKHKITVIANNTLTDITIPQSTVQTLPNGRQKQILNFDFFNYGGIDRPVVLYTTGIHGRIEDITVSTTVNENIGIVNYKLEISGYDLDDLDICNVSLLDKEKNVVASEIAADGAGSLKISNPKLWWPYLMSDDPGYLYTLKVELRKNSDNYLLDEYDLPIGIRELKWDNTSLTINGKPVYLRGFGRHEDSTIRGKGFDLPVIIRDHNLIRWIGANSYRTSHYPYAEEIMDLADRLGIMIIDEVPSVHTLKYSEALLTNHKRAVEEMYKRDKNRPSVLMWSLANEPRTNFEESKEYYRQVVEHMKSFETTRPVAIVYSITAKSDHSGEYVDIVGFNRYDAWYSNTAGDTSIIVNNVVKHVTEWHTKYNKPVLITEYGADTIEGLHDLPSYVWSEEYQLDFMAEYFKAFDKLYKKGWFIGEMIWNFADFQTGEEVRRVGGNRKGIFTRDRQPKAAANFMRKRYWNIAERLDNATMPSDLTRYIITRNVE